MSLIEASLRKWRDIAIEAPEDALEAPIPVPEGMRAWKNKKNEFCVVAVHYSSDPEKRSDEWYAGACKGLRPDQIERELELNFDSRAGTKAFPYLERNESLYRLDPPHPIPKHWRIIVGMDYGARNPTSIHWYAVDPSRRFWCFDEFYQPLNTLPGGLPSLAKYLLSHPYYARARHIVADPSIFNKGQNVIETKENSGKAWGTLMSVAELLQKEGVHKLQRGNNDRITGITRVHQMFNFRGEKDTKPYAFIGRKCVKLWWELNNLIYKLDDKETKNADEDVVKRNDHCFVAGTLISTPSGQRPIESIRHGELVLTRGGARKAVSLGQTGIKPTYTLTFSNGATLQCTGNHPIWTENRGWVRSDELEYGDRCVAINVKSSSSIKSNFEDTQILQTKTCASISALMGLMETLSFSTGRFGPFKTARSRQVITFITRTATRLITASKISNAFRLSSTLVCMGVAVAQKSLPRLPKTGGSQKSGMVLLPEDLGIRSTLKRLGKTWPLSKKSASSVGKSIGALSWWLKEQCFAALPADRQNLEGVHLCKRTPGGVEAVFNLSVGDYHEYFANGILVSNSFDEFKYVLLSEDIPAEIVEELSGSGFTIAKLEEELDSMRESEKDPFACSFAELDGEHEYMDGL